MKIKLHEIRETETHREFTQADPWVVETLKELDETSERDPTWPLRIEFKFRKIEELAMVEGKIDCMTSAICSRCGEPFALDVHTHFHALYSQDETMGLLKSLEKNGENKVQTMKGTAGRAFSNAGEHDTDYEITTIDKDELDLKDVILEQARLAMPFQPYCKEHRNLPESRGLTSGEPEEVSATHRPFAMLANQIKAPKK